MGETTVLIKECYELLLKIFWEDYLVIFIFSDIYLSLLLNPELSLQPNYIVKENNIEIDIYGKTKNYKFAIEISFRRDIKDIETLDKYVNKKIKNLENFVQYIYFILLCNVPECTLLIQTIEKLINDDNIAFLLICVDFDKTQPEILIKKCEIFTNKEFARKFLEERKDFLENRLVNIKSISINDAPEFLFSPFTAKEITRQYKILFALSLDILILLREIVTKEKEIHIKNLYQFRTKFFEKLKNRIANTLREYIKAKNEESYNMNEDYILERYIKLCESGWKDTFEQCVNLFLKELLNIKNTTDTITERKISIAIKNLYKVLKILEEIKNENGFITKQDIIKSLKKVKH